MNPRVRAAVLFAVAVAISYWAGRRFGSDLVGSIIGLLFCMYAATVFVIDRWSNYRSRLNHSIRWSAAGLFFVGLQFILRASTLSSMYWLEIFLLVVGLSCIII